MKKLAPEEILNQVEALRRVFADLDLGNDDTEARDSDAWLMSLESETDVIELVDELLAREAGYKAHAQALGSVIDDFEKREKRFEERAKAIKETLATIMAAIGEKKLERPAATLSISKGQSSVAIDSEDELPEAYFRIKREVNKAAIAEELKAGGFVPGAHMEEGRPGLRIRRV